MNWNSFLTWLRRLVGMERKPRRQSQRPVRRSARLTVDRFEDRFYPNDPFGFAQAPLVGTGLGMLAPLLAGRTQTGGAGQATAQNTRQVIVTAQHSGPVTQFVVAHQPAAATQNQAGTVQAGDNNAGNATGTTGNGGGQPFADPFADPLANEFTTPATSHGGGGGAAAPNNQTGGGGNSAGEGGGGNGANSGGGAASTPAPLSSDTSESDLLRAALSAAVAQQSNGQGADHAHAAASATATAQTCHTCAAATVAQADPALAATFANMPLPFEVNAGQTDSSVNFLAHGPGFGLFLTPTGATFGFVQPGQAPTATTATTDGGGTSGTTTGAITEDVVAMSYVGANASPQVQALNPLASRSNYFSGDSSNWHTNVDQFGKAVYKNLYPGIDAVYFGTANRQLEFDFNVAPGADPSAVQLGFQGASSLSIDAHGNLDLSVGSGDAQRTIAINDPVVYQTINGTKTPVTAGFTLTGTNQVGFSVGSYDNTKPLVIDPTLGFSSYLGGSGADYGYGIAVDNAGNIYVTGQTSSTNFPSATGTNSGNGDAFVTKLTATGQIIYSSYLGGSNADQGNGIAVDLAGDAYVTGYTTSSNFPTANAYQSSGVTGTNNAFVTKLNPTGDTLIYSTYLSGSMGSTGTAIAVDAAGSSYVTGYTSSAWVLGQTGFPTTTGAYQTNNAGGTDAFVTKFNPGGSTLAYSTYLGGGSTDQAYGIAVDGSGNAYVTGNTNSTNFPTTSGALQTSNNGGYDAFVTKLNSTGTGLSYSTYLGGGNTDQANAIAVDASGEAFVTGTTQSTDFPTTTGAYQTTLGTANSAAFVTKLNAAGSAKVYSTYLRGSVSGEVDQGYGIAVNTAGNAYLTGNTSSTTFPTTTGAFQTTNGGGTDAFVTRLLTDGTGLSYSSYLGGASDDEGRGIALDPTGVAYVTGYTNSTNFPTAGSNALTSNGGGYDAFVSKVLLTPASPAFTGITTDSGLSSSDQITNTQNLHLLGTATANATVTLYRADVGQLGTTTANGSGAWNYDYSGTTLAEGTYAFTATQTVSGVVSPPTTDYLVTVDLTNPAVTLTTATTTAALSPWVYVTATDLNGVPNDTTNTSYYVQIDVDKNNDGNFTDTGESGYATGVLHDGAVAIQLPKLASTGTYPMRARVLDIAGNQGTSATVTVNVYSPGTHGLPAAWTGSTAQGLTADPIDGQAREQLGNMQLSQAVNLDQSGGGQTHEAALVYNSDSVSMEPIIQATIPTDNAVSLPASITATLTWNVGYTQTVTAKTFTPTASQSPGDLLTIAVQTTASVSAGRYPWKLTLNTPTAVTLTGYTFVVPQDSSALGAGWTFGPVMRLVNIAADNTNNYPAGQLMVYGTGGYRFFSGTGPFTSPANDNGTLTVSGGTYTYYTPDGQQTVINSSGYETSWTSADGQETLSYRYDGSNRLIGQTAIDGALATITYGSSVVTMVTANNRTTTLSLDASGNLTKVTNPDGGVHTFTYDSGHRMTGETFGGTQNEWAYSASGALATITWGATTGAGGVSNPSVTKLTAAAVQGLSTPYDGTVLATATDGLNHTTSTQLDGQGRPLQEIAADGSTTTWARDANGRVTAVTDALNRTTTYALDSQGYVTQTTLPDSNTEKYQYQAPFVLGTATTVFHALTSFTDERNNTTTYAYDNQGHQTSMTDAVGDVTKYAYSASGLLTATTDPLNHVSTLAYDSNRRLTASTDPANDTTTYTYDNNGYGLTTKDPDGNVTTTSYDVMGRLTQSEDAQADYTTVTYDAAGLELTSTDPLNHQTSMVYDGFKRGLVAQTIDDAGKALQESDVPTFDADGQTTADRNADGYTSNSFFNGVGEVTQTTDPLGDVSKMTFDLGGQETAARDPLGNLTQNKYSNRGFETTVTDAKGDVTSMAFDAAGNETTVTDPNNHTMTYVYDALNRQTVATDANGNSATTAYDAAGRVGTVTNARGYNTVYGYDSADRQTTVTEAAGTSNARTTTTGYDKAGNVTSQTDGLNTMTYSYDKDNRQTATTDGLGHTTTVAFDAAGNETTVTDALNKVTTFAYDDLNRQIAVTDPNNHTATSILDAIGNPIGTDDPLGDLGQTGYDAAGRSIWQIDPKGDLTQTFYDAAGNQTALTDPVSNTTTFAFDTLNRQTLQTNPNGSLVTMSYDAASRLTQTIDADSRTMTYAYDSGNRQTGQTWKNSSGTVVNRVTFTYDNNGNRLTAADTNGTITLAYDNRDRLTVKTDVFGVVLTYTYDAADRRTLVQDSLGGTVTSVYDAANRLTSRQLGAVGTLTNAARVDFAYNNRDALTTLTRFSDAAGTTVVGTTIYSYDNANRVTTILHDNASNATLSYYAYNYDNADRVTSQNWKTGSTTGAETYTYDAASQLLTDATASGTTTYTYDNNGNRTIVGYQTGTGNELTNDGTWTYTYDQAGNMTQKANANNNTVVTYSYDNLNHLTAVNETISGATTLTVSYTYDVLGERVEQDKWKGSGGGTVKTRFAYDGANIWADTDTSNNVLARYLYGDGADQILAHSVATGQTNAGVAFYLTDLLGSVRDLENTSQTLIDHLDYSAFGIVTETSAASGDRNKYEGQWDETDIGFVLTPARPDSPSLGRFVITDPTGFGAGDSNLYRIVGNDPTNATDPSGLAPELLAHTTVGPIKGIYGQFQWGINWSLSEKTPTGGFIVQHVDITLHYDKTLGKPESQSELNYYEIWRVPPHDDKPDRRPIIELIGAIRLQIDAMKQTQATMQAIPPGALNVVRIVAQEQILQNLVFRSQADDWYEWRPRLDLRTPAFLLPNGWITFDGEAYFASGSSFDPHAFGFEVNAPATGAGDLPAVASGSHPFSGQEAGSMLEHDYLNHANGQDRSAKIHHKINVSWSAGLLQGRTFIRSWEPR
jgi:RHS repeat-associated protein